MIAVLHAEKYKGKNLCFRLLNHSVEIKKKMHKVASPLKCIFCCERLHAVAYFPHGLVDAVED